MQPTQKPVTEPVTTRRVDGQPETDPAAMSEEDFARWCAAQDDRAANGYAEQQLERYLAYHEAEDVAEMEAVEAQAPPTVPMSAVDEGAVARTMRDTAWYLAEHGWIQGSYYDATTGSFKPPACLVGAVGAVCYGGPVDAPAQNFDDPGWGSFEAAVAHLDGFLIHRYDQSVYDFNDARGRTGDEVVEALHLAAVSDPSTWLPACCGSRMVECTGDSPRVTVIDRAEGLFEAERTYVCFVCRNHKWREVTDADELAELFVGWKAEADNAVHDGHDHLPGMSYDCDACDEYCYCTIDQLCTHHGGADDDARTDHGDAEADDAGVWRPVHGGAE